MTEHDARVLRDLFCAQVGCNSEGVSAGTTFDDLGYDSLDTIEAVMSVEERFDITIDETTLPVTMTLGEAEQFVAKLLDAKTKTR